jgi:hypothetical protein
MRCTVCGATTFSAITVELTSQANKMNILVYFVLNSDRGHLMKMILEMILELILEMIDNIGGCLNIFKEKDFCTILLIH